jgi:hypothetical protein
MDRRSVRHLVVVLSSACRTDRFGAEILILVFGGAGASKALDRDGYPTTEEFFRRLPESISTDPLFSGLAQFVRDRFQTESIDIEQWLWVAAEARETFAALGKENHPAGWLFNRPRMKAMLGQDVVVHRAATATAKAVKHLEELEDRIKRHIYKVYAPEPPHEALLRTWVPLLQGLSRRDPWLEVFTTNYDVVLEEAIADSRLSIETGRVGGVFPVLDDGPWIQADADAIPQRGLLTKLHGSVDWSRIGPKIHCGTPSFTGDHNQHVIIYPGFKGMPETRPFTLFHEHFIRSVARAEAAVFIGFAFRDGYINQVLRDGLDKTAPIVVVDPAESLAMMPFEADRVVHIKQGFGAKSTDEVLAALASLLEP